MRQERICQAGALRNSSTARRTAGASLLACAALTVLAGGCANGNLADIQTVGEFNRQVLQANQPVVVDFYKESCPTCVIQEACLEDLAGEYDGKVRFVKFKIRESNMAGSAPEMMDRYGLFWVPTAILFVNGQERKRWVLNHAAWEFRPALDEALGRPVASASPLLGSFSAFGSRGPKLSAGNGEQCGPNGCPINRGPAVQGGTASP